ncbi:MAG: helix-turn-helix domain-containing protein [Armatimonadetes bacterium]|nr:helix-turn-helix domain-containing protein [Armatimonadota bacterium]
MKHELGLMLKRLRRALGLIQKDVAARIGASRSLVARWETGDALPSDKRIVQLADVYSASAAEMRTLKAAMKSDPLDGVPRRRRRTRLPYPIGATVEQMLAFGAPADAIYRDARKNIGDVDCQRTISLFPRDTGPELLFVFHVLRRPGARLVEHAPDARRCSVLVLDDYEWRPGGDLRQPALYWRGKDELMIVYGQVRVVGGKIPSYRVDFLIYYKRKGRGGQWLFVELDGSQHKLTPSQDADRAVSIRIPQIRYDNERLRSVNFFEQFIRDVRDKADMGAAWSRRHAREARLARRRREYQAKKLREAI